MSSQNLIFHLLKKKKSQFLECRLFLHGMQTFNFWFIPEWSDDTRNNTEDGFGTLCVLLKKCYRSLNNKKKMLKKLFQCFHFFRMHISGNDCTHVFCGYEMIQRTWFDYYITFTHNCFSSLILPIRSFFTFVFAHSSAVGGAVPRTVDAERGRTGILPFK